MLQSTSYPLSRSQWHGPHTGYPHHFDGHGWSKTDSQYSPKVVKWILLVNFLLRISFIKSLKPEFQKIIMKPLWKISKYSKNV